MIFTFLKSLPNGASYSLYKDKNLSDIAKEFPMRFNILVPLPCARKTENSKWYMANQLVIRIYYIISNSQLFHTFTIIIPMNIFYRKKKYIASASLSGLAWRKFKKNPMGMSGLIYIMLMAFVAIAGYLITPDQTPFANHQVLEISTQKPGFAVTMLKLHIPTTAEKNNFLKKMLFGKKSRFQFIPVKSIDYKGCNVFVETFEPHGEEGKTISYPMTEIVYGGLEYSCDPGSGTIEYINESGQAVTVDIKMLAQIIESEHIVRKRYLLGTDRYGRDLLSLLMIGTRVSLSVGFISVFISLVIGILLGSLAGYFRGRVDDAIIWFINVIWSIPTLLLVIAITFALGKGFWQVFIAVGLTMWVEVARVVRGQIISVREKEFVEAARALGFRNFRIITRHILPNVMGPVIVISAANFASAILLEAGLSFLGIGVQPPMPSWGTMIKENYGYIVLDYAYLAIAPGIAIMLLVLAFMLAGNALRDAMDVREAG